MARSRKPGSGSGRPSIDWETAFRFYASLPDQDRSYKAVADHYKVSVRTVEKHGRDGAWRARLANVKADAAVAVDARLAEERAEKLAELDLLIDASLTTYAHQLRAGQVKVTPVDLPRLYKLREDMQAQIVADSARQHAQSTAETAELEDPEARRHEIVRALYEAGAFDRLTAFLHPTPSDDDPTDATGEEEAA